MTDKIIFVTSALPYVNNVPHLGNIIGSTLSGDIYTRHMRRKKHKVIYLCGTDEYGTTTEIRAKQEQLSCQEICDKYTAIHYQVYKWFDIQFDIWGRTTNPTQEPITHDIFTRLYMNDYIEQLPGKQYYCIGCKMYLADRYLNGICNSEYCTKWSAENKTEQVTNGDQCDRCGELVEMTKLQKIWCIQCNTTPELRDTTHLFLRLGQFKDQLVEYSKFCQMTPNAQSITQQWLDQPLHSRCITRNLSWGTKLEKLVDRFPELEPFKDLVFYVWFDAPIGYLSILLNDNPEHIKMFTENKNYEWVAFMAKDNVPFHSIVFPSTIIGCNKNIDMNTNTNKHYPVITQIRSTEYLQYEGTKFSKSRNIGVFGDQVMHLSKLIGIDQEYWRYYLTRIRPENRDTSFSWSEFCTIVRSELCNNLGNLINRVLTLAHKCFGDQEFIINEFPDHVELINQIDQIIYRYDQHMDKTEFTKAINHILIIGDLGNQFLQTTEPWKLIRTNMEKATSILCCGLYIVQKLSYCLEPIIPQRAMVLNKTICMVRNNTYCLNMDHYKEYGVLFKPIQEKELYSILDQEGIYYKKI